MNRNCRRRIPRAPAPRRRALWLLLLLGLAACIRGGAVTADQPPGLRLVSEYGGIAGALASEGDRVYLALHSRIVVLAASADAASPSLGSTLPSGDRIHGMDVRDGIVVTSGPFLRVLDARDPAAIHEVGRLALRTPAGGKLRIVGDEAWLVHGARGIMLISLADPAAPRPIGHWRPLPQAANGTAPRVVDIATLADGRVALLVDGSTANREPSGQSLVLARPNNGAPPDVLATHELACCAGSLEVDGPMILVGSRIELKIDALSVQADDTLAPAYVWRPGDYAHMMVSARDGRLWVSAHPNGLYVLDSQTGSVLGGPFPIPYPALGGMVAAGEALASLDPERLLWIDASGAVTQGPPIPRSAFDEIEISPQGLWALGSQFGQTALRVDHLWKDGPEGEYRLRPSALHARAATRGSRLLAIADRLFVASWWTLTEARAGPRGLTALQSEHEVVEGLNHLGAHLVGSTPNRIVTYLRQSKSDGAHYVLTHPIEAAGLGPAQRIVVGEGNLRFGGAALDGDVAWVDMVALGGFATLQGHYVRGPDAGQPVADALTLATATALVAGAADGLLAIRDGPQLFLMDVSRPTQPRGIATVDFPGPVLCVAMRGRRLWVGFDRPVAAQDRVSAGGGLSLIDLADPEDPVEIARVELGAPPTDIVLDGDVAWVAVGAVQAYTSIAGAAPDTPTAIHTAVTTPTSAPPPVTATRAPAEPTPTAPPADPSLRLAIPWASSP